MNINPNDVVKRNIIYNISSEEEQVQQVGIDLKIVERIVIKKGEAINVLLKEKLVLPNNVYSMLYGRSSFNRKCVLIRGSVYDPGYKGQIGCTIYNMSNSKLVIAKNTRICQMVFHRADSASEYKGQWQGEHL